jgi:hypothetical protein
MSVEASSANASSWLALQVGFSAHVYDNVRLTNWVAIGDDADTHAPGPLGPQPQQRYAQAGVQTAAIATYSAGWALKSVLYSTHVCRGT